ncbi:hypothetical protein BASA60_000711 [Batrachochytrium salamandrivorans]|nr:hypothetical protein BASA60_000711 [Batrachochytrium salamandrivorans]
MLRRLVGMDNSTVSTADSASEGLLSGMSLSGTASLLPTFTSNGITPNHSALTGFNQKELIHSLASRLLHSTSYQVFYVIMAVLSLVCLAIVSLVGVRFLAYRKRYWHSVWNILDIVMVLFCVVAFVFVVGGACDSTKRKEAVAEEILLIFRNGIQFSRLVLMMQKNRTSLASRTRNIDIGSVSSADAIHMVPDIDSSFTGVYFDDDDDYV